MCMQVLDAHSQPSAFQIIFVIPQDLCNNTCIKYIAQELGWVSQNFPKKFGKPNINWNTQHEWVCLLRIALAAAAAAASLL